MPVNQPDGAFREERYTVRAYEIDQQKRMAVPALVCLMQQLEDGQRLHQMGQGDVKKPLAAMWIFAALFCFLFLPCLPTRLAAQSPAEGFKKIPIEVNGIPFNQFVAIVQDREGFLWLRKQRKITSPFDSYLKTQCHLPDIEMGKLFFADP